MNELLEKLNDEQIKPVCDTEGHVLVLAGAGSGKTRVLTSRIAYILDKKLCYPSNILAITFTNKAAGEMKERVAAIVGDIGSMWICTIHSMCVKILRQFSDAAGFGQNFSIYSETEKNNVIKKTIQELDFDDEKLLKSAKYHIGNAKMLGLDPDQYGIRYKDEDRIDDICVIYEKYNEHLRQNNALDFDDLLLETLRLLRRNEEVKNYLADKFKYIMVDEFQDTNSVQYNIIKLLASKHGNLFAVGDDDQSIYGWRGAEIENILRFDKDFPDAKVYKLERNYRSTKAILNLANTIIANNGTRHKKTLWTEAEEGVKPEFYQSEEEAGEALFAAKTISQHIFSGGKYSDFAVLMRINALTRSYEQEFTKYGIPYKVFGGFKFFERKEIKDVLAYMRLISNPFDDEALTRIINVPKRGIGGKTLEVMGKYASDNSLSLYDACLDSDELGLTSSARTKISDFANAIKELVIASQTISVSDLVKQIIDSTDLRSAYNDGTDEGDGKLANLDEFIASVEEYNKLNPDAGLDDYLSQVTLSSDTDDMDDSDYVTLATIHSVKGLEFKNVIICGLEDGIMPSSRSDDNPKSLEEERRLMYVAITRAEKELFLTRSKSRYLYGKRDMTKPSRFLTELSTELGIKDILKQRIQPTAGGFGGNGFGSRGGNYGNGYGNNGYGNGYNNGGYGNNSYGNGGYSNGGFGSSYTSQPYNGSSYGSSSYNSSSSYGNASDYGYHSDVPSKPKTSAKPVEHKQSFSPFSGFNRVKPAGSTQGAKNYTVGMKVRHPKFGLGTVIAVKNNGSVINVAFDGQGIKELSASLAPLEIL